ncbi:MAG: HAMP domain-containing protein [Chloroflexaceae bacterium]|nr:HAMP domain-containing protein [Chloroflexaceae bacterium]
MRFSLTLRLTFFFLLVALVTALLVFVTVRVTRTNEFQSLIAEQELGRLESEIESYYTVYGSLTGFDRYIRELFRDEGRDDRNDRNAHGPPGEAPSEQVYGSGASRVREPPFRRPLGVVSPDGRVIVPNEHTSPGMYVPDAVLARSTPVQVEGTTVALILPRDNNQPFELRVEEELYLERTTWALMVATVGAVLVALVLGALFARTLTRPIRELMRGARALGDGQLGEQVAIHSRDELGELARTFNQMSQDLAQATHMRRQMTADIAHELRTPLQVIGGYVDAMVGGDLAPTRERLTTVYAEIEHLQHLVADLRMLSQADAGELLLHRAEVAPAALLERVATTYAHEAEQQNITLTTSAEADLPMVWVDEERLLQVLRNLVSNALRHTPAGGRVGLRACCDGQVVCLAIQDSGVGIAAEELQYLFERFYRVDRAREHDTGSSGLGLAIARVLVEVHGGTLTAASAGLGCGATFTISLPRGERQAHNGTGDTKFG